MDELKPPPELSDLWLGPRTAEEDVDAITGRVLRDARHHQRDTRAADAFGITLTLFCVVLFLWPGNGLNPPARLAAALFILLLAANLIEWGLFYRLGDSPPDYSLTSREHVTHWLDYIDRRTRFLRRTEMWAWIVLPVDAVLWTWAGWLQPDPVLCLGGAAVVLFALVLGVWMSRYMLRQLAQRKASLQDTLRGPFAGETRSPEGYSDKAVAIEAWGVSRGIGHRICSQKVSPRNRGVTSFPLRRYAPAPV